MNDKIWLIRYSEIFLKSEPVRRLWEDLLIHDLQKKLPECRVFKTRGRIWVSGHVNPDIISHTFGVHSFSLCNEISLIELKDELIKFAKESKIEDCKTFALIIHRTGNHPFRSQDLARDLGAVIQICWPHVGVDLEKPELKLYIDIYEDKCYLYCEIFEGPGGIPHGASGSVVALHSGGIDSPVAMYMMMKRGCILHPVYVKIAPFHDDSSEERARLIINHLKQYQPDLTLKVIDDTHVFSTRMKLRERGQEKYACVLCKRYLYRTAAQLAAETGSKGIVTGESLSQVASQTLDNLYVLDDAVDIPVFRPLIGFDKEETIILAKKIGTYDLSIMQVPSCCCTIPMKPATTSKREMISGIESELES